MSCPLHLYSTAFLSNYYSQDYLLSLYFSSLSSVEDIDVIIVMVQRWLNVWESQDSSSAPFEVLAVKIKVPAQASLFVYDLYDIDLILLHTAETEETYEDFGSKWCQGLVFNVQLLF